MVDLKELKEKYPYPNDMDVFTDFIQTYKTQLLLLREKARVNNNQRLFEAIQNLFEDYLQYSHDRTLYEYHNLEVNCDYDDYLLNNLMRAAKEVRDYYAPMWKESRSIPVDNGRYSAGIIRWGDACSGCNRLATDIMVVIKDESL